LSVVILALAALAVGAREQERIGRVTTDLSGDGWTLTETDGRTSFVSVPHSWNIEDGCDGKGVLSSEWKRKNSSCASSYERKRVVYRRPLPAPQDGRRTFVRCEGASIFAEVFVNGKKAGEHLGAFTAFCCEITELLKPASNVLEIAVDNFSRDDVAPPVNADFTMYGGLCRGVTLIETPQVCIDPVTDGASGVRLWPDAKTGRVRAEIRVSGGSDETREFAVPDFRLWSPETPVVYTQRFEIASGDAVVETFGFRTVEMRKDGFYLNGNRRKLRGTNYHQDREGKGWAVSDADRAADVAEMKALGCDAVRTAHYPHAGALYRLFDEQGLLAWCEQPNVNGLRFNDAFRSNAWRQTREMVMQLGNHPSIFCWSIFNELYNKVPMREGEPEAMMEELRETVRALDPTRPVAAASDRPGLTRLNAIPEALGFNRYPGWYGDIPMPEQIDDVFARNPSVTTMAMSEYGAGGSVGTHGDPCVRCQPGSDVHTVECQAFVHADAYRTLAADPRIWGSFAWCLFDFGSDCRLEGARHGRNDKGLLTFDHRTRKDVWYLYAANWTTNPVLRLVGTCARGVTNATVNVLGFSNLGEVTLTVNGTVVGRQRPDAVRTVLWRDVPMRRGRNEVVLSAGGRTSVAKWDLLPQLNYDPARIGEVKLEDPLAFADGTPVRTPADWERRRTEILELLQREMYGRIPSPIKPVCDVIDEGVAMGGFAIRKLVRMWFREDRTGPCVNWLVLLPRQAKQPSPAILVLNYGGNHELLDDEHIPVPTCWMRPSPEFRRYGCRATAATRGLFADPNLRTTYPVGMLLARGFAVATACYQEVSKDVHGRLLDGNYPADDVLSLFPYDPARADNPTALGAWAWALMRGYDLLAEDRRIEAGCVTVCGSSRLGKAALLAGAFDTRFYAVVPNQTGGGGCPLMKRNFGENAEAIQRLFPHWVCKAFAKYVDNEKAMPFDSHLLLACVAPRKLLVEGFGDPLYDTEGEYLAAKAASPAWTFLGESGLPDVAFPQPYDLSAVGPRLGYVRRTERHGFAAIDWTWLMDFVLRER